MKKSISLLLSLLLISQSQIFADEGMWLPMLIKRLNYTDMQKMGLQLTPEELYSVNNASMKDAIVGLSNDPSPSRFFCTGSFVSNQGLIFTNHHCGFGSIQKHSSIEHDYLKDGFWAMNKDEELPNEGLSASILIRMDDITHQVLEKVTDEMDGKARLDSIRSVINSLKAKHCEQGKYNVVIKDFYNGNEYFMFIYQVFKDVRLVGAPPSSIGNFGGDTDNWMWPRHTGDFSMFRVYTAPDGSPAEYSKENIPYQPKYHLPISLDGINENDFTMTWGFPGTTERYLTSYTIDYDVKYYYPALIDIFNAQLGTWKKHMDADRQVMIKYASKYGGLANYRKKLVGTIKGVDDLKLIDEKRNTEDLFMKWVNNKPARKERYGNVLTEIEEIFKGKSEGIKDLLYTSYAGMNSGEVMRIAHQLNAIYELLEKSAREKNKVKKAELLNEAKSKANGLLPFIEATFKDYDKQTDIETFGVMNKLFVDKTSVQYHPEYLMKQIKKSKGNYQVFASRMFASSFLDDYAEMLAFLENPNLKKLQADPIFLLMQEYMKELGEVNKNYKRRGLDLKMARKLYLEGIQAMNQNKSFYPDANGTLRISYGKVDNYIPQDGVSYNYKTHLFGIIEKEDAENEEFIVPDKLQELYKSKDYGKYASSPYEMTVCYLTTNDITGGNSGSPVINGEGELVGLAFDGNWEAMSSDLAFIPDLQRCITADIRYVLFVIDKYAGAGHLINEMQIKN